MLGVVGKGSPPSPGEKINGISYSKFTVEAQMDIIIRYDKSKVIINTPAEQLVKIFL